MAKAKGSLIGAVGALLIGAAILLFVTMILLNALRENGGSADSAASRAAWNTTNDTITQLINFLTISVILLGVLGVTMIGASIIGYISGAFGG